MFRRALCGAGALLLAAAPGAGWSYPLIVPDVDLGAKLAAACAAAPAPVRAAVSAPVAGEVDKAVEKLTDLMFRQDQERADFCILGRIFEIRLSSEGELGRDTIWAVRRLARGYSDLFGPAEAGSVLRAFQERLLSRPEPDREALGNALEDLAREYAVLGLTREAALAIQLSNEQQALKLRAGLVEQLRRRDFGRVWDSNLLRYLGLVWKTKGTEEALAAYAAIFVLMLRPPYAGAPLDPAVLDEAFRMQSYLDSIGESELARRLSSAIAAAPRSSSDFCRSMTEALPQWFASAPCSNPLDGLNAPHAPPRILNLAEELRKAAGAGPAEIPSNDADRRAFAERSEAAAGQATGGEAQRLLAAALAAREGLQVRSAPDEARLLRALATTIERVDPQLAVLFEETALARLAAGNAYQTQVFDDAVLNLAKLYSSGEYSAFRSGRSGERAYRAERAPGTRIAAALISAFWGWPPDDPRLIRFVGDVMRENISDRALNWKETIPAPAADARRLNGLAGVLPALTRAIDVLERSGSAPLAADLRAHVALFAHEAMDQKRADREISILCRASPQAETYPYDVEGFTSFWCDALEKLTSARKRVPAVDARLASERTSGTIRGETIAEALEAYLAAGEVWKWTALSLNGLSLRALSEAIGKDARVLLPATVGVTIELSKVEWGLTEACSRLERVLIRLIECRYAREAVAALKFTEPLVRAEAEGARLMNQPAMQRRRDLRNSLEAYLSAYYEVLPLLAPADQTYKPAMAAALIDHVAAAGRPAASPSPESALKAAQSLKPYEAIVGYAVLDHHVSAYVIRNTGIAVIPLPVTPAALRQRLADLRASLNPTGVALSELHFDASSAHYLHSTLIQPLEQALKGAETLYVLPDGPLHSLPFAALVSSKPPEEDWTTASSWRPSWLVEKLAVANIPSLDWFVAARARTAQTPPAKPFIGWGAPAAPRPAFLSSDESLAELAHVKAELEGLAKALRAEPASVRLDFSERDLWQEDLSQYRVIAFATHGFPGTAEREPLLLAGRASGEGDALLTAGEFARLRLNADLVILSACDSGADGGVDEQTGMARLVSALSDAGARSLLVSHWPVISEAAGETTIPVAAASSRPAAALKRAMGDRIKKGGDAAHPAAWAPFYVVGVDDVPN